MLMEIILKVIIFPLLHEYNLIHKTSYPYKLTFSRIMILDIIFFSHIKHPMLTQRCWYVVSTPNKEREGTRAGT